MAFSEWDTAQSSNVAKTRYDPTSKTLEVEFLNGSVYEYLSVPKSIGPAIQYAQSPGKFVWQVLRDQYPYKRIA